MVQYKDIWSELNTSRNRKYGVLAAILVICIVLPLAIVVATSNPFSASADANADAGGSDSNINVSSESPPPTAPPTEPSVQDSITMLPTSSPTNQPFLRTTDAPSLRVPLTPTPTKTSSGAPSTQLPSLRPSASAPSLLQRTLEPTRILTTPVASTSLPSSSPTKISLASTVPEDTLASTRTPTMAPSTTSPSLSPTSITSVPTFSPSAYPTKAIVDVSSPTRTSPSPEATLTFGPVLGPTSDPSATPGDESNTEVTYRPGNLNTVSEDGLILSEGLGARMIARKNRVVQYDNNLGTSTQPFHGRPDFGATFPDTRPSNLGGWIYVSNSEMEETSMGGVGALTFDSDGNLIDYHMVLEGTTMNCGGGKTPWDTWVSCEEVMVVEEGGGQIYEVDPLGVREAVTITMGNDGGRFESFTYDIRDMDKPRFFATEDRRRGPVRRFTPDSPDWEDPWNILKGSGKLEFLLMDQTSESGGTFTWIEDKQTARLAAPHTHPECEGIEVVDGRMYLVAKRIKVLFILDLDAMTYTRHSTTNGAFDGSPDQVSRVLKSPDDEMLYFTEEGGNDAGVHGRNTLGQYFTILEGGDQWSDETTGLSFSPNGKHMYVAFQAHGALFDVFRLDGLPFNGKTLNIKYHNTDGDLIQPSEDS